MRIFKRVPDQFAQSYQQEFQRVYGKARMKATIAQARTNAIMQARADAQRRSGGVGLRDTLKRASVFSQGWAADIEKKEKSGMGLGYGMGVYGSGRTYGKRRR